MMLMLIMTDAVARFERELILERQKEGNCPRKEMLASTKAAMHILSASQTADLRRRLKLEDAKWIWRASLKSTAPRFIGT
jgi:hypothetical protein